MSKAAIIVFLILTFWLIPLGMILIGKSETVHYPSAEAQEIKSFPEPRIKFAPPNYVCYRAEGRMVIDGKLDERSWKRVPWTEDFIDIEGPLKPRPRFRTRAKMLWDDNYFYVGAELEENDVWATLTRRDSIIYYDNDFEVFIDPDGDSHEYYELEVNALGTVWDLLLIRPYRDGGPAVHSWDIQGLKADVRVNGTVNRPGDKDKEWTVEIAFPLDILKECIPGKKLPSPEDQWRVNFSRVEYWAEVKAGKYEKRKDSKSGQPLAEDNWVWAPIGLVNIHYPEMWGYVQFSGRAAGKGRDKFNLSFEQDVTWSLRRVYYKQKTYFMTNGRYAESLGQLGLGQDLAVDTYRWPPELKATWNLWEAWFETKDRKQRIHIRQDGRLWKTPL